MNSNYWVLQVSVPNIIPYQGEELQREDWIALCVDEWGAQGANERVSPSDQQEWIDDAFPQDRISEADKTTVEFYFSNEALCTQAERVLAKLPFISDLLKKEKETEDWNRKWKESFEGVTLSGGWQILPPWKASKDHHKLLIINPGSGFGTGTHETTQLCLDVWFATCGSQPLKVLDFGSGSGILSIAAAKCGSRIDAVEIDPMAIDNAVENVELNGLQDQIRFYHSLDDRQDEQYDFIFANVLKNVLLEYSKELCRRLNRHSGGSLVLSGLLEPDLKVIEERYRAEFMSLGASKVGVNASNRAAWWALQFDVQYS